MMRRIACLFSLFALVPAAVSAAAPAGGGGLAVLLCTGDGSVRAVTIPIGPEGPAPAGDTPCCAKGCHTGSSRKRGACG